MFKKRGLKKAGQTASDASKDKSEGTDKDVTVGQKRAMRPAIVFEFDQATDEIP